MTVNSPRMQWTYPSREDDPWYDFFEDFVLGADASGYAHREDRSIIWTGGGTVSWDLGTETLTWTGTINIYSPIGSRLLQVAASSLAGFADGEVAYVTLARQPLANQAVALNKASQLPSNDNAMSLCVRIGDLIFFRTGISLGDGDTSPGVAPLPGGGGSDPNAIHDNIAGEIDAISEKLVPTTADIVLIEDKADSENKKKVQIGNLPVVDANAIHDNVSGEIAAVTPKASPILTDRVLIEDSAAGNVKKSVELGDIVSSDPNAIHDDEANEISAIAAKASPVGADLLIIEDSEAANVKKSVQISNLPGSDLRGPAIVVGSTTNGDTSDVCDYLDTGNGAQLEAAIQAADDLTYNRDVWVRPGLYDLGAGGAPAAGITVPSGVKVRGAGQDSVAVKTKASGDLTAFYLSASAQLEDLLVQVTKPTGANTGGSGAVVLGSLTECRRVGVDLLDAATYTPPSDTNLGYLGAFYIDTGGSRCRLIDCVAGVTQAMPNFALFGANRMVGFYVGSTQTGLVADFVGCRAWGGDYGYYAARVSRFNDCWFLNTFQKGFFIEGADAIGSQVTDCWGEMTADQFNEYGVHVKDVDRVDVSNNRLVATSGNPSASGVYLENADDCVIQGNRGTWPISVNPVLLDATSNNNVVLGNHLGTVTDNGTGNDVAHNK